MAFGPILGPSSTGPGSGSVTSVSVTTANGVSGSVATATTTPAITLTLGNITPTAIRTAATDATTVLFQARDVDGAANSTFATLTAGNTPSFNIAAPAGGTVAIDGATIGATTAGAATVTTLSLSGVQTFSANSTITSGSYQIGRNSSSQFVFNSPGQAFVFNSTGTQRLFIDDFQYIFTQGAATSGVFTAVRVTGGAHTGLTASNQSSDIIYALNRTVQFATGALSTQSAVQVLPPTYGFVGASTITTCSTIFLSGAPSCGTNATITTANGLSAGGATTQVAGASFVYNAISVPTHTLTLTGSTSVTSRGPSAVGIEQFTLTDASAVAVTNASSLYIADAPLSAGSVTLTNAYSVWVDAGNSRFDGRVLKAKGANVAAANDLALGIDGNTFSITGATQINAITTLNWTAGSQITLIFASNPTVKNNTAGGAGTARIFLAGSVDLVAAANTVLGLVYDGTQWQECFRKAA